MTSQNKERYQKLVNFKTQSGVQQTPAATIQDPKSKQELQPDPIAVLPRAVA
jgi:hypothetical protein